LVDEETFEPFPLNDMNYFKADAGEKKNLAGNVFQS
jgi:hypothetical protein